MTHSEPQIAGWDPLGDEVLPADILSATVKRVIKNILKSYTGWFDPFSEMIQNALDAIDAQRRLGDPAFVPRLRIEIDLAGGAITVMDNGTGLDEQKYRACLAPNVSFKGGNNRGNKGVGATYLAYGFNYLHVDTKSPEFTFSGTIKNGREWVEDEVGAVSRPHIVHDPAAAPPAFAELDRGSAFTLKLIGEHIRPKKLDWLGAISAEQWCTLLRVRTPLGGAFKPGTGPAIDCSVTVRAPDGTVTSAPVSVCEYLYPHRVVAATARLSDIRDTQATYLKAGKDASKLPDKFYKLNGLFNVWDVDAFLPEGEIGGKLSAPEQDLAKEHSVWAYAFFAYSTDVWDQYNDNILKIRKGERILRGGIQLATNLMPQGDVIQIPLKRNIGYQNVCHVLVHLSGADPDLGRKGFQPELENLAKNIAVLLTNTFLGWRSHLKSETGAPPDITSKKGIHDWIVEQEEHEKKQPLVIKRDDAFLPIRQPAITSAPLNEQDVVALFNQLLAGGIVRGVRLMSASQYNQYDGICRFVMAPPIENHVFDAEKNPLGVLKDVITKDYVSAPLVLEYKFSFDGLVEEFEKEVKNENDIGLLVAWKMGEHWKTRYEITSLLDSANIHHRYFHGATHIIKRSHTGEVAFPAIILSELIDYLNDPGGAQLKQQQLYG